MLTIATLSSPFYTSLPTPHFENGSATYGKGSIITEYGRVVERCSDARYSRTFIPAKRIQLYIEYHTSSDQELFLK